MPKVEDITITTFNNTLTASWADNPIGKECGILYEITFERESLIDRYRTYENTVTTKMVYCVNTTVSIKAIYGDLQGEDVSLIFDKGNI